jgi:hypothetical protein
MKNSKGVPPKREIQTFEGIDPSHEAYVYFEVPVEDDIVLNLLSGVPPTDAI